MNKYKLYNIIDKLWNRYLQFIKFCIIGITNVAISYTVYYILLTLGLNYLLASAIAYLIGILNGYIWSSKFVFNTNKSINNMVKFFIVYISALFINLGIMYICVDCYNMHKLIAPIFAIGIGTIYNYSLNKIWTFRG
jgi:putative flippase GtrA